jgi:hypothetical protein
MQPEFFGVARRSVAMVDDALRSLVGTTAMAGARPTLAGITEVR